MDGDKRKRRFDRVSAALVLGGILLPTGGSALLNEYTHGSGGFPSFYFGMMLLLLGPALAALGGYRLGRDA